ncbi:MAG: GNAT family N-acetyltransferase [Alphaproteobacteria bacterium]|nr:GNAT family N-acetyltransferase [Alphaproteobacteria bacterium]
MKPAPNALVIRPCFEQDLQQVQLIYAHHVMTGTGSFETEPPDLEEMARRWGDVVTKGWPYLVASPARDLTRVLGFAYAAQFRMRPAYAKTFEDSVYVAPTALQQGVGKMLLAHLLQTLREDGVREVIGVIGDSGNAGSVALHKSLGFKTVGVMTNVGFKFDRWLDVMIMQRSLRAEK